MRGDTLLLINRKLNSNEIGLNLDIKGKQHCYDKWMHRVKGKQH